MGSPEDPTTNSKPATPASVVTNDTVIALVATVIMFSVIFSVQGMAEQVGKSTVGMLFISLPELFYSQVPFGSVLGPLFYVLIALAALTSTMSLLEVVTAYVIDERGVERRKATLVWRWGDLRLHHSGGRLIWRRASCDESGNPTASWGVCCSAARRVGSR
ncbi:MAG TPA: hypothetical protein DGN59_20115 [Candidatus Latescibacteria bacterium]|nr:hypothetical protein [Candidatus Latescibacterota bacterium]